MGLRFITDPVEHMTALYDSVTVWAFGPVFQGADSEAQAEAFCDWAETQGVKDGDVRAVPNNDLYEMYGRYCAEKDVTP